MVQPYRTYDVEDPRADRFYAGEYADDRADYRSPIQQDRDRVLYSVAFRRLGDVTQVTSANELHLFHNRLTHSLKVAQVGRRLTEYLMRRSPDAVVEAAQLDPDLTETAGLAHDLGHPPFGHVAEHVLNDLLKDWGGFEGNAQTFRILTKIGFKKPTGLDVPAKAVDGEPTRRPPRTNLPGLDLTRASLAGVLKYPLLPGQTPAAAPDASDRVTATKPGIYSSELQFFSFARKFEKVGLLSPTAVIMDWSDDISYAVHDVEDHTRAGLMPFHLLEGHREKLLKRVEVRMRRKNMAYSEQQFDRAFDAVATGTPNEYDGSVDADYDLQKWMTAQIVKFERAVSLVTDYPYVRIDPQAVYEIEILKALTWEYVIDAPLLAAAQQGQRRLIRRLFEMLVEWANTGRATLPIRLNQLIAFIEDEETQGLDEQTGKEYAVFRGVSDYISSLTEHQCVDMFQRISGVSPASIFASWMR